MKKKNSLWASALILSVFLFAAAPLSAQRIKSMEFRDQDIADILLVLAEASGKSIVPDETVTGKASFFFSESEFEEALSLFLATYRLHSVRAGNVYHVSRIAASFDKEKGLANLEADEVDLQLLVRTLSKAIGRTILFDPLPRAAATVNIAALEPERILQILMKRFPEYAVEKDPAFFYVKRLPAEPAAVADSKASAEKVVVKKGEGYALSLEKGRFLEVLVELFAASGKEYSLLTKSDSLLENLYFSERDFDSLLRLILEQGNADFIVSGGVYYIVEFQRRDIVRKLKTTTVIPLVYLQAAELPNLLPADLGSGSLFRIDRSTNAVILTGSDEETRPVRDFIALVDRPLEGKSYVRIDARYLKAKDLIAVLPARLLPSAPVLLPDGDSFVVLATDEEDVALRSYSDLVDRKAEGYPVRLRFLKTEEFLKALPPSAAKEDIVDSGTPNLLFYTGSDEKRKLFLRELAVVDKPKPQIRYELLVLQFDRSDSVEWSTKLDAAPQGDVKDAAFLSNISEILSFKFDIVSQFGFQFASALNMKIGDNKAQVYADTTLNGLSGQEIKFQNTSTFRYREKETDPDTGKTKLTGVTREITSGLLVGLNGWVSGDGMITMTVNATVSKRGADVSSSTGDPPPTWERVVTTQVRTASGKPVVIGGLLQKNTEKVRTKVPLLGDIPFLGMLFQTVSDKDEDTEIVIYVVPYVGPAAPASADGERTERYYRNFVEGRLE